jgi:hypothetical protein
MAGPWYDDRRGFRRGPVDSGQWLLVAFAGLLIVWSVTEMAVTGDRDLHGALAFGALIALGELLRINLPGDREAAPIATAGALAYALLLQVGNSPVKPGPAQVIAVSAIGMLVGALPHLAVGRPAGLTPMSARLLAVAAVAATFRPLANAGLIGHRWLTQLPVMLGLVLVAWLVEAAVNALVRTSALGTRFAVAVGDELRIQFPIVAAAGASALLIAFAAEVMGLATVAVFAAPLLVTQVALRRYAGIRATYLQTVRALARVTEIGGYVETGHSARVSRLAVAIGRELGMPEAALLELEYAALMHDIGQLSLRDPVPGGATVLVSPDEQRRIAEYGAEVIQQARVLDSVADIVRRQSDPCRPADRTPPPPLSSRIIRAANAFDDLVGTTTDQFRAAEAVERIRLNTAAEYDPRVIDALASVVGPARR